MLMGPASRWLEEQADLARYDEMFGLIPSKKSSLQNSIGFSQELTSALIYRSKFGFCSSRF
jgi:hypothetical protein